MKAVTKIVNFFIGLAQSTGGSVTGDKSVAPELKECAFRLAADSAVLLKNEGGVLPFSREDKIAVFGRVQRDYFAVGYGSGGDVKAPYKVNLIDGIKANGKINYDRNLAEIYQKWCDEHVPDEGFWGHWPLNFPEMSLYPETVEDAAKANDKAVVIIGRAAGEDREQKLVPGGYYLSRGELEMLDAVTAKFKKVVVVLNVGNIVDMTALDGYGDKIAAVLLVWQGGMESGNAVAALLSGDVSPSGKLPDTVARSYCDYPSSKHFGRKDYNNYTEDIYVGYRFFETFRKDRVLYPFGYGLSYTEYERSFGLSRSGERFRVDGIVRNVGGCPSKDVVEVYVEAPQGKLGKPTRSLVAFKKTKELKPGELERLVLEFDVAAIASYDESGLTGHKSCLIAEGGEYNVYAGGDAHNSQFIGSFVIDETVVEQLDEVCCVGAPFPVLYPTRDDLDNFEPTYRTAFCGERKLKIRIENKLPKPAPKCGKAATLKEVKDGKITLDEFVSTLSDEELEQLTHGHYAMNSSLGPAGNAGAFGGISEELRQKGIPPVITTDGPSGIRLMQFCSLLPCGTAVAAAWDIALTERLYACLGKEMKEKGTDVILGPGMNIHRDPLCGRNFEYYSEDPLLSGKTAAAAVRGVQSEGVSACPKHFACNNQETARAVCDSRVSERALREIYLKGFEICVKESAPHLIMTSYNKINGVYSYHNYDLCTTVLRGEWGYEGCVTTDWWSKKAKNPDFEGVDDNAYRVRAQADVLMPGGDRLRASYERTGTSAVKAGNMRGELERSAKNVLNLILSCPSTANKIK